MNKLFFVVLLAVSVFGFQSVFTPLDTPLTAEAAKCFFESSIKNPVIRVYVYDGRMDPYAEANMKMALDAGYKTVDVVMAPCMGCNPESQALRVAKFLKDRSYVNMVWIDTEYLYWMHRYSNEEMLKTIVSVLSKESFHLGIISSRTIWDKYFDPSFTEVAHYPLMYMSLNKEPSFKDFTKFGGWKGPQSKFYDANGKLCNMNVGLIYYE